MKMIRKMKSMLLILFALFAVPVSTNAQQLTEQQALQNANDFLAKRGRPNKISPKSSMRKAKLQNAHEAAYYVFNVGKDEGFVIASGDERTEKILGYSDNGTFNEDNLPDNMKAWLQGYAEQISNLPEDYVAAAVSGEMSYPVIEPLIKTKWGQSAPYNAKCPEPYGHRCVTGCVPTALAQILNYHQYPNTLPALDAYSTLEALPEYAIDWNSIKNEYTSSESDDNVAWLMRYCGQAVHVNYGISESSVILGVMNSTGTAIESPLREKFGYNKYMKAAYRGSYSVKGWNDLLISELKANRPVYLSGNGAASSGHAFICDGYDGKGLYHINWGWDGICDGYFCIEILNPYAPDVMDEKNRNTYSNMLNAAIGVTPQETMIYPDLVITCSPNQLYSPYGYWESIHFNGQNADLFPEGKMAIGVFDERGNLIERRMEHDILNGGGGISSPIYELGIDDGHYYLKALFKPSADEDWHDVSFDWNVIELIKEGAKITVIDHSHRANDILDLSITTNVIGEGKVNTKQSIQVVVTNNGEEIAGKLCCDIMGMPNKPIRSYGGPSHEVVLGTGETMTFLFEDIYKECNNFKEMGRYNYRLRWEESQPRYSLSTRVNKILGDYSFLVTDENGSLPPVCSTPVVQSSNGLIKGKSATKKSEFAYLLNLKSYGTRSFAGNAPSLCYHDQKIEIFMYAKAENHIPSDFICDSVVWKNATLTVDSIVSQKVENADLPKCAVPRLSIRDNLLVKECDTEGANYCVELKPEKAEITIPNNTPAPFLINIPVEATADADGYENSDIVYGHLTLTDLSFCKGEYAEIAENDIHSTIEDTDITLLDNVIYIEPVASGCGKQLTLSVKMKNKVAFTGYKFDLYLPDGCSFTTDEDGFPLAALSTERTTAAKTNYFDSSILGDPSTGSEQVRFLRVLCYSSKGYAFTGEDGEIATVTIDIPADMEAGDYALVLKDIELAVGDESYDTDYVKSTLTVTTYKLGDANDDGKIGVADLTAIASHILGTTPTHFVQAAADANEDGKIGVADLTCIAGWILNGTASNRRAPAAASMEGMSIELGDFTIVPGGTAVVPVSIDNGACLFSGYQFDVRLPEGFHVVSASLADDRLNASAQTFDAALIDPSTGLGKAQAARVLCYSPKNTAFFGNAGVVAYLTIAADNDVATGLYSAALEGAELSYFGTSMTPAVQSGSIRVALPTEISNIESAMGTDVVYDISGRRVPSSLFPPTSSLKKGLYIMNGKKIVK